MCCSMSQCVAFAVCYSVHICQVYVSEQPTEKNEWPLIFNSMLPYVVVAACCSVTQRRVTVCVYQTSPQGKINGPEWPDLAVAVSCNVM